MPWVERRPEEREALRRRFYDRREPEEAEASKRSSRCASLRLRSAREQLARGDLAKALAELRERWKQYEPDADDLSLLGEAYSEAELETLVRELARRFPRNELLAPSTPFPLAAAPRYERPFTVKTSTHATHVSSIDADDLAASPTEPLFATAGLDGLAIWDEATGRAVAETRTGQVSDVEFSPDGASVTAFSEGDRFVYVLREQRFERERNDEGSGYRERTKTRGALTVRLADYDLEVTRDGELVATIPWLATFASLALSADGEQLCAQASISIEGINSIACWNIAGTPKELFRVRTAALPFEIELSPDGRVLAVATTLGLELRDAANGRVLRRYARSHRLDGLAMSSSGRVVHVRKYRDIFHGPVGRVDLVRGRWEIYAGEGERRE